MRAAVLHEIGKPLVIEDVQVSEPGPREVLVRTAAVGVCHSDLHIVEGSYREPLPMVLGHESAGVVERVGSAVRYVSPGDHVITCLSAFCGHCEYCLTGRMALCKNPELRRDSGEPPRLSRDGREIHQLWNLSSFAEQMLIHEHALVKIRPDMPLDRAALIGCAVTTGFGAVQNTAKIEVGSSVAIIGCGGVGLAVVNGAAIAGAGRIVAIDVTEAKLDLARRFGATDTVNGAEGDAADAVVALTGDGVDYAFEALGRKETAEQAFRMLRRGGTATVIGMIPVGDMIQIHGADLLEERRIQGSSMGSNRFRVDIPRYVDFYLSGKLLLDPMISARISLDQVNEAFDEMKRGEAARSVIVFDS